MRKTRSLRPLVHLESLRRAALKVHASVHQDLFKTRANPATATPRISSKVGVVWCVQQARGSPRETSDSDGIGMATVSHLAFFTESKSPCESRDFHFWQLSQFADEGRGRVLQDEVRGGGQARSPPPPPPPFALPSPNIPHPTLPPCTHTWSCYGLAGTTNSLHNDLCLTLRSPATLALSVLCTTEPEAPSHTWEIHCDRHSSSTLRGLTGPLRHVSFTIRHDGGRPDSNGQTLSGRIQVSSRGQ
jgi:hypothetical protein